MSTKPDWVFNPYLWRGKTYKTISGLCRAVMKVYPRGSVSFGALEMHVRQPQTLHVFDVVRHPDHHEICDQPKISTQR